MAGIVLLLVFLCFGFRLYYGLRRPHFWLVSSLVTLIGLPCIVLLFALGVH